MDESDRAHGSEIREILYIIRVPVGKLRGDGGLVATGVTVKKQEFMLCVGFPEFAFGLELVLKEHVG